MYTKSTLGLIFDPYQYTILPILKYQKRHYVSKSSAFLPYSFVGLSNIQNQLYLMIVYAPKSIQMYGKIIVI